jgi:hypothetical protein
MPTVPEFRSIITNDEVSGFRITIPAKRRWGMTVFLLLWLCGWAVGEVGVGMILVTGRTKAPWGFLLLWLACWTYGGLLALFAVFWNMSGREVILINDQDLVVRRELGGFHREWGFALAAVRNLRYSPPIPDHPWRIRFHGPSPSSSPGPITISSRPISPSVSGTVGGAWPSTTTAGRTDSAVASPRSRVDA